MSAQSPPREVDSEHEFIHQIAIEVGPSSKSLAPMLTLRLS